MKLIALNRVRTRERLLLAAVALWCFVRPARADEQVSFTGEEAFVSSTPVSFSAPLAVNDTVATGTLTAFGPYALTGRIEINVLLASGTATSTMTFTNGDQVFLTMTGHALEPFSLQATVGTYTVTGGTGRFTGATGGWSFEAHFDFPVNAGAAVNPYTATLEGRFSLHAATEPALGLELHGGLRISGAVGHIYAVEYVPELAPATPWRCLAFLQLPASNHLWLDPTDATGTRLYRAVELLPPTNMVFIPPGTFRMGSPSNEVGQLDGDPLSVEGPQMAVTISRGFWMGAYEVTQAEYLAVMGINPSGFKGSLSLPVETVSWYNATNYCGKLTQRERGAGRIATNSVYRLPTEAEWEYACRAWTSTRYSHGDDPDYSELSKYAWYDQDSDASTHPVGQKLPNPWGLYDMHGNAAEWCQDRYGAHPGGIATDPQGPATGSERVAHSGLWFRPSTYCRSAFRRGIAPDFASDGLGFRVVLAPGQP